jgi:2-C-methyl-D-erythritol 4-phosphate cytidylyltransferase
LKKIIAVIPAGGEGKRAGNNFPKQYIQIGGKEIIVYTLQAFHNNQFINEIIVAAAPGYISLISELKEKYNLTKLTSIVEGGKERQDSVHNCIKRGNFADDDIIAVHDAARPLLTDEILTRAINTALQKGNAVVAIKAGDTLVEGDNQINNYLDRSRIWYIQTPQLFNYKTLSEALTKAAGDNFTGTDESMIVKKYTGEMVHLVEGGLVNFKVTTSADLKLIEQIIKNPER